MLEIIVHRMSAELENTSILVSDPLLWLMHGGPGTGKSEVLKLVQTMFLEVCGWQMSIDYQMMSLQAVMAQLLHGDTIHHALGINPFGDKPNAKGNKNVARRRSEIAQRVLQWRWLFIDEISIVSAQLIAEVDRKLRSSEADCLWKSQTFWWHQCCLLR